MRWQACQLTCCPTRESYCLGPWWLGRHTSHHNLLLVLVMSCYVMWWWWWWWWWCVCVCVCVCCGQATCPRDCVHVLSGCDASHVA